MREVGLLTDQAFGESGSPEQDGLGFSAYAEVLSGAALGTTGPFTVGIFGEWGTGKTSLMRMIQRKLSDEPDVVTVWFNAWRFEQEEHPIIVPLLATIIRELQHKKGILRKLGDTGKSLVTALRAIAYGFSAKSKVRIPGFAEIEASLVAKDMIQRSDKLTADPLLDKSLYYQAFERLSNLDISNKVKIVVIVDDLDRCFPDVAIKLLESIKLVLSQPGFVFILGVSRSVIEGYLSHRYKKEYGLDSFQGHMYLDKIVQLPFYIPPHRDRMEEFSTTLLQRIEPDARESLREILPIVAVVSGSNPRATIRFVNNLLIDRAINHVLAEAGSMEVIPIGYFAVSRSLQQRWRDMFSLLVTSEELCSALSSWEPDGIGTYVTSSSSDEVEAATRLVSDRDLQGLLFSEHGRAWLRNSKLRRAAIQFLRTQRQEATENEDVFDALLVHSDQDLESASKIAEVLSRHELRSLLGTHTMPGGDAKEARVHALSTARAVVVLIGPRGIEPDTTEEMLLLQAIENSLPVLPVLLPGADSNSMPFYLKSHIGLILEDGISEQAIAPLIAALKRL
jgi:hypothetical protein